MGALLDLCARKEDQFVFGVNENISGQGHEAEESFEKLRLTSGDVNKLYSCFMVLDADGSGEIDLPEFYGFFKMVPSPFADRVFTLLDADGSGEIDFMEFVLCLWNYCSFNMPRLVRFAFELYDGDDSGVLEMNEIELLIKDVYGGKLDNNPRIERILTLLDADGDGEVTYSEFKGFNSQYPILLFPAYRMQEILRSKILGRRYWERQESLRLLWGKGRQQNLHELLGNMNNNTAYIIAGPEVADERMHEGTRRKKKKKKKKKAGSRGGRSSKVGPTVEDETSSFAAYLADSGYKGDMSSLR